MGISANLFHWKPETFWRSTPHEYWAAFEIWKEMHPPQKEDDD